MDGKYAASEWTYRIRVDEIDKTPKSYFLSASEEDRAHIARRLNVVSVDELSATLNIVRGGVGRIEVEGQLKAKVIQECVVTLEPLEAWIEEDFDAWFADTDSTVSFVKAKKEQQSRKGHVEVELTPENEDPEPIVDGNIEAGELVVQYLSLAINPYPKAEGVQFERSDEDSQEKEPSSARRSPFEALKNWKAKGAIPSKDDGDSSE